MFKSIKNRNILLILLNARITKRSFDRWSKFKKFSYSIFGLIDKAYSQNSETNHYLKRLNVKNIQSIGNIKFIGDNNIKSDKSDKKLFFQFKKYKTFIAASTHETEELFAAKTHILLKKKNKNIITIIIPRHINRVKQIIAEIKKLGLNVVSRSSKKLKLKGIDIFIVDTFGETKNFISLLLLFF